MSGNTGFYTNIDESRQEILKEWLLGLPLDISAQMTPHNSQNVVKILIDPTDNKEDNYKLDITKSSIILTASGEAGIFYGIQTLKQLYGSYGVVLPALSIEDSPGFSYRGLLLDSSRRFWSVQFIKKQLDMMSRFKLNRFVWYLSGDGGWRIGIPGYPEFTDKTSWRSFENYVKWKESGGDFVSAETSGAYGGFYTDEDIRQIVDYAKRRFIEVIPAIDVPCAHRDIGRTLGRSICPGEIYSSDPMNAGALDAVVTKLTSVFDSQYIYIGNGNADKERGTVCPTCRPRVDNGREPDSQEAYAVTLERAEKIIKGAGKKLMTYEESLRGHISDDALIVCWHDAEDAAKVVETGRSVVLSASEISSLDYYQNDPMAHSEAMTGFLPLDKLYAFTPSAANGLVEGVQANLWASYVETAEEAEYMLWPRLLALAETGWTPAGRKSYYDFRRRATNASEMMKREGYNVFDISTENTIRPESVEPANNLALGKTVIYNTAFDSRYAAAGKLALVDGERGGWAHNDGRWQGFQGNDLDVIIDLESITDITSVSAVFMQDYAGRIWLPTEVEISGSEDGKSFDFLGKVENELLAEKRGYYLAPFGWEGEASVRYVRYKAKAANRRSGWMFTDEIIVR